MPKEFFHYDVLFSCPSDMVTAKNLVCSVVNDVNNEIKYSKSIQFDVKFWSEDVLFSHGDPQDIINNQIVNEADIIVAIFGLKLGTPTRRYESGTIEEIEIMIQSGKQVFVCFQKQEITISLDTLDISGIEQYNSLIKVNEFKKKYKGLYIEYETDDEFQEKLRKQLILYSGKKATLAGTNSLVPISFVEDEGKDGWRLRHNIENAKKITFCARTGKMFITTHYHEIRKMLENGGKLEFVTSYDLNLFYDEKRFKKNGEFAKDTIVALQEDFPDCVSIFILEKPLNVTLCWICYDTEEYIDVKFIFQTKGISKRPLIRVKGGTAYFDVFKTEINEFLSIGSIFTGNID